MLNRLLSGTVFRRRGAASGVTPINFKVNFFTGTVAGWFETGSTTPVASAGTNIDYGEIVINGVGQGIGIRALNASGKLWAGTSATSGGTAGTTYPDAVQQSLWFTQSTNGADFELYEITAGKLAGKSFTIKMLASRASITGPRTTIFTAQSGQTGSVDASGGGSSGNDTLVTLTGVTPNGSNVIRINVKETITDATPVGYINGMEVLSE